MKEIKIRISNSLVPHPNFSFGLGPEPQGYLQGSDKGEPNCNIKLSFCLGYRWNPYRIHVLAGSSFTHSQDSHSVSSSVSFLS